MSLRDELEKRACWYLAHGWCSAYDYCLKKIAELDAKEDKCYWGSERDCLERINEGERNGSWGCYAVDDKIVTRREFYIYKRDQVARSGFTSLSLEWAQKLADLDAKEAREKAAYFRHEPVKPHRCNIIAKIIEQCRKMKEEGDKMNDVFVHVKASDYPVLGTLPDFQPAWNYSNPLQNELGRIKTAQGYARFLGDVVEHTGYVTSVKTTYSIKAS